jgi:hypothetical protein
MSGVSGSKFLSSILLVLMTKTTCSSFSFRPPPVQKAAETDACCSENPSGTVAVRTRKKRKKHRRKARKQQKEDAMNFLRRVIFDLSGIWQPNGKAVTNVYVDHPGRRQTVLFTCVLLATLTCASSPGKHQLLLHVYNSIMSSYFARISSILKSTKWGTNVYESRRSR